jgi:hypothetical protein
MGPLPEKRVVLPRLFAALMVAWPALYLVAAAHGSGLSPFLLIAALVGLASFALTYVAVWLVMDRLGRRPGLAFVPAHWIQLRRWPLLMAGFAALVLGAREHAFGDTLAIGFEWGRTHTELQVDASSQETSMSMGDVLPPVTALPTCESFHCSDDVEDPVCAALAAELGCRPGEIQVSGGPAAMQVLLSTNNVPACYTPLGMEAAMQVSGMIDVSVHAGQASRNVSINVNAQVTGDAFGPLSCWAFRRRLGQVAGQGIRARVLALVAPRS